MLDHDDLQCPLYGSIDEINKELIIPSGKNNKFS